jgi:protoporphyrinogen oxidase
MKKIIILGAGPSGLGFAHEFENNGIKSTIYEKNNSWGGLCDNFSIGGYRFDRFVHFSFSERKYVNDIFLKNDFYRHSPNPFNYYQGHWIKHPAQNNLFHLSEVEKANIIKGFNARTEKDIAQIKNYDEWLKVQYGDYFSENFAMRYTRKYWTTEAKNLETKWVGSRMYKPTIDEIMASCYTDQTPNTYYAKEMRYPKYGGYKTFLSEVARNLDIRVNKKIVNIDISSKSILFEDGKTAYFDKLISSIPLPEYVDLIGNMPSKVIEACQKLAWTEGVLVSIGFNKPDVAKHLWYYIYDEDILPARVYSPSLKSLDNTPNNTSSVQAEIYFSKKYKPNSLTLEEIKIRTINQLGKIMNFTHEDVSVSHVKYEPYANVIFDHDIYKNRKIVHDYFKSIDIIPIGRFGLWAYLWSDQSMMSGVMAARKLVQGLSVC